MARPKVINPQGDTIRLAAYVPAPLAQRIQREAKKRGITVAQVVREKLEKVA